MYVVIHLCFVCALLIFNNSLKVIKIDRNVSELKKIVCKNIILTSVLLLVLLCNSLLMRGHEKLLRFLYIIKK
jgi:hypothetical protein